MNARRVSPLLLAAALAAACDPASEGPAALDPVIAPEVSNESDHVSAAWQSGWSEPVRLAALNSDAREFAPSLSADGRTLYFASTRGGGPPDLWVGHRPCRRCDFGPPERLPSPLNDPAVGDAGPFISADGRYLFFNSVRTGGGDIYVSRRQGGRDGAWGDPTPLGTAVNSAQTESHPHYLQRREEAYGAPSSPGVLYFDRNGQIMAVGLDRDLDPIGEAVVVAELDSPFFEGAPSLTEDGLTIYFHSPRTGSLPPDAAAPFFDLWTSTRQSIRDRWSPPVNLGAAVNSEAIDWQPGISFDGRTLVFISQRETSQDWDLWMTTRLGGDEDDEYRRPRH